METQNTRKLNEHEKQQKAWDEVINRASKFSFFVAAIAIIFYFVILGGIWLFKSNLLMPIFIFLASLGGIFSLWLFKEKIYKELFSTVGPWQENYGTNPKPANVNVEKRNGDIVWNVHSKDLDWTLAGENPIVSYMEIYEQHPRNHKKLKANI